MFHSWTLSGKLIQVWKNELPQFQFQFQFRAELTPALTTGKPTGNKMQQESGTLQSYRSPLPQRKYRLLSQSEYEEAPQHSN